MVDPLSSNNILGILVKPKLYYLSHSPYRATMRLVYHSYKPDIASFALYFWITWMPKTHLVSTCQESFNPLLFFGFYGKMEVFKKKKKQFLIQSCLSTAERVASTLKCHDIIKVCIRHAPTHMPNRCCSSNSKDNEFILTMHVRE